MRVGYQIHVRRRLYYDDYFVLVGAICLCAAIGIVYKSCEYAFLVQALLSNPSLISEINAHQTKELLTTPYAIVHAFFALSWTTIFAVKFSFLIFFKKLIDRVPSIHAYYWIVVIISLVSWLFSLAEPFILCSHPNRSFGRICSLMPFSIMSLLNWFSEMCEPFPRSDFGIDGMVDKLAGCAHRHFK